MGFTMGAGAVLESANSNVTSIWTGLTNAIEKSSAILEEGAGISAAEAKALANDVFAEMTRYSNAVLNYIEGGTSAEQAVVRQQMQSIIANLADIQQRGDAALEAAGRQIAEAAKQASRAEVAKVGGGIVDAANVISKVPEAIQTGNWEDVGKAVGGVVGSAAAAEGAAAVVAAVAAVVGITGIPLAVGAFIVVAAAAYGGDWLGDNVIWPGWHGIYESVSDLFNSAPTWRPRRDPLVLDLDGDGIETTAPNATNPVLFDHDNNGIKTGTGWVKPDDGFLVMDRNGNGTIDSGAELFGDHTPLANGSIASDGFAALADLDSNGDGKISSSDASFANLRVWRDLNQDGISQANELFTLDALNIAAINVAHTNTVTSLGNGNTVGSQGTFTRTDGSTSAMDGTDMADVNLAQDTFHRQFTDTVPLAAGVSLLPNMQGSGMVRDLWEAANENTFRFAQAA